MPQSWDDYCDQQDRWLSKRPTCGRCGNKIQDEYCWEIEPGEYWCESCKDEWLRDQCKNVDDLVEEGW